MKATIHQPNFMPYLGFFDKCDHANILVIYDSTQFKKNDFQNRNRIKGADGGFWLTVPVKYKFGDKINEVKIDNSKDWKLSHLRALEVCYSKSKYFEIYY
ncbi:MAG: WbqC family protein, partial [Nanoarchaeota archaeon]|nr:WbqC family protein [Nanoarchaeota archaeon]